MNIYLVGYRCSGKTTIGQVLAVMTRKSFLDMDELICDNLGMTISEIIEKTGWEYFRIQESKILSKVICLDNYVIAFGGGIVIDRCNVDLMKNSGIVIWLKSGIEIIKHWILVDEKTVDTRPSLTEVGVVDEVRDIMNVRIRDYSFVSDLSVLTDCFDVDFICLEIINKISCFCVI